MEKFLKIAKNILVNLIIFVLILIAIIAIYSCIQLNILNKEYINIFGYSIFQVETGSMSGTLEIDDIVIVKLDNNISENDIITYKKDNNIITHRAIRIEDELIIPKGDNNNTEDNPIEKKDIIGKVTFTINNVKVWKSVFSDMKVIISISITIILLILLVLYKEKMGDKDV